MEGGLYTSGASSSIAALGAANDTHRREDNMRSQKGWAFAALVVLNASLGIVPTKAETYRVTFSAALGPQLPWIRMVREFYIPEVNKRLAAAGAKDSILWTEAFGGTLAKIGGELAAVENGLAEMSVVSTIFEAAKLPLMSVTFMAPFGSDDAQVVNKIILEMHREMPEMMAQWVRHKQVFVAAVSVDTDYIMTTFPVNKIADLKGRKLGAAGSLSLWVAGIGAVPVQGDFATHYNNIKTGVYDGLIAFSSGVYPARLHQVAPHITRVDLGAMLIGALSVNKAFYDRLPPYMQNILVEVGSEYTTRVAGALMNLAKDFDQKMEAEGAKVSKLPADERRLWANTMPNIAKEWVDRNEARGVPAGKVLATYMKKLRDHKVELARDWDKK